MARTGKRRNFDAIVIGSGIAGLSTALSMDEAGLSVAILSKEKEPDECNTRYAQGGIVYTNGNDSPDLLFADIMAAGSNINSREAVKLVVQEGPRAVREWLMEKVGVPFCRDQEDKLEYTQEGAHSVRRIIHVKDTTGLAIENALLEHLKKHSRVKIFTSHTVIDLVTNSHNSGDPEERYRPTRVIGAYVHDSETDTVSIFFAGAVILATGGVGQLFLHTSNTVGATGDGMAMAQRIGAEIINAEYIQFHPTILYHRDVKRFLISEAVRGEGARLMNKHGEYFMKRYNPRLADLAPRDEVARAIFCEMEMSDTEYVFLDTRGMKSVDLGERFPGIYSQCKAVGIDMEKEPVPVVPAAHYFCGGIKVDSNGMTSIPGLFAVGENACTGVHGANRLASVSLLEGLVWGLRCAAFVAKNLPVVPARIKDTIPEWIFPHEEEDFDPVLILQDLVQVRTTMWNYAGIVRNKNRLSRALSDLNYLSHGIEKFYRQAKISRRIIELRNCVLSASIIVRAAQANRTSCGCHFIES